MLEIITSSWYKTSTYMRILPNVAVALTTERVMRVGANLRLPSSDKRSITNAFSTIFHSPKVSRNDGDGDGDGVFVFFFFITRTSGCRRGRNHATRRRLQTAREKNSKQKNGTKDYRRASQSGSARPRTASCCFAESGLPCLDSRSPELVA